MPKNNFAILEAEQVKVLCPHCGEEQPNPWTGDSNWLPWQVRSRAKQADGGKTVCTACDEPVWIAPQPKAAVSGPDPEEE